MKRNPPVFLFAAWMILGVAPHSLAQPNPIVFDGKFYSGTIAAPNRYDISAAGDGSILVDISNDALFLKFDYHFLNVTQLFNNERVAVSTDNTGDGLWGNCVERAFSHYSPNVLTWNGSYTYYSNDCEFVNFQSNADGAGSSFDENGKLLMRTAFYIAKAGNAIPFPRRILLTGHFGGSHQPGNFKYQFPTSAQFCDPSTWPEFVLATVSGVGPVYYYAYEIFEIGSEARGDGDGRAESGERLELGVKLINMGDQTAEYTTAILQTSSPFVTIVDSSNYWENISGGEIKDNLGSFVFDIDPNLSFNSGVNFKLKVAAVGGDWTSTFTVPIYVQDQSPLNAPSNLVARLQSDNASVQLTWQDNSSNEDGFKIERAIGIIDNWSELTHVGANVNSFTDTGLSAGQTYFYRVRAFLGAIYSDYSNVVSHTVPFQPFTSGGFSLPQIESSTFDWGDYDSDGDLDILVTGVSNFSNIARIYRNDSTNSGRRFVDIGVPLAPLAKMRGGSVAWGDYDNDGDLDALLAGYNDIFYISKIYRNDLDGNGRKFVDIFAALIGGGPAAWGDYDNDGDLDIFIRGKIYRNDFTNNGRSFGEVATLMNAPLTSAAWGDYDNDGDLDILAGNKIYRNDNLTFVDIAAPIVGVNSTWGDYDNDGDFDVLISGMSNVNTKVYRNDGGNFVVSASLTGVFGSAVAWGDYDNDGDLDILTAGISNNSWISRIYRNDAGNFVDIAAGLAGVEAVRVAWGDYDNDDDLDILLSSGFNDEVNGVIIYRNNTGTANTHPAVPVGLAATLAGNAVNLSWNKSSDNETAQEGLTYNLRVGTTPDGNETMGPMAEVNNGLRRVPQFGNTNHRHQWTLKNLPAGNYYWSVQAIDNAFAGSAFANEKSFVIALPITAPRQLSAVADQNKMTLTWLPNTESDILRYRIYRSTSSPANMQIDSVAAGSSTFVDKNVVANTVYFYRLTAVNQALQESPFSNEVSAVLSASLFTEVTAALEGVAGKAAWGDYDNDGDLDILLAGFSVRSGNLHSRPVTKLYRNDRVNFIDVGSLIPAIPSALGWGDYDNDGDVDILLSGNNYDPIDPAHTTTYFTKVLRNDGSGIFTDTLAPLAAENGGPVAWGDYDNDGDLDIFGAKIYRNEKGQFIQISENSPGAGAFGDYDNDGDLDLLTTSKVYRNDNGVFVDLAVMAGGSAWGDYDQDGDLDILRGNKIYRNDGGNFVDIAASLTGKDAAWGDYDNDGDLDIFVTGTVRTPSSGDIGTARVYRNDAGNFTLVDSTKGAYGSPAAWGDYDNDGDLDILLVGRASSVAVMAKVYRNNIGVSNTAPASPVNLTSIAAANAVTLAWNKSTDHQTAQNGLTYNLRVGTIPGSSEIMSSQAATVNGLRRVATLGNTNHSTQWPIKNLAPGKYYWSVQAIDNAFAGSAFAPEQSFVIHQTELKPEVQSPQTVGQEFWMDVAINNVQNLFGASFELNYTNTAFVDVVTPISSSVVAGTFLGNDVVFIINVDEAAGKISIGLSRKAGQGGASGSGIVARVKFIATPATPSGAQVAFSFSNVALNEPSGTAITANLMNATVTLNLSGLIVWPGDANNDRLVNQADILPLGLHFNKTGPARQNASSSWTPQLATAWTAAAATYADANGDGTVNQADVLPIGLHFGKSHTSQALYTGRKESPQGLQKTNAATILTTITGNTNPGQDFTIDVNVSEVANLFGVSFELLYSPATLVDPQKAESGSLMGNDPLFFSNIDKTVGKLSIGNTRKAGQDGVSGSGTVARIEMRVSAQAVRGQAITLTLQNVSANDANGQPIALTIVPNQIIVVSVAARQNETLPQDFALHANTPNPFNPTTAIHYDLPQISDVRVEVFDLLGTRVRTLVQKQQTAGRHVVVWDGRNENGQIVASGVFIFQLQAANSLSNAGPGFLQRRKMLLLR